MSTPGSRDDALARHHVCIRGEGRPTMVFAHGFGCDQSMWRHVAPAFEQDHQVVCFDHAGSGRSDLRAYDSRRHATLHGYAEDLVALCDALDLSDICFVGHSVSATIGLLAAVRAPERFGRMVFVAPTPCFVNDPSYQGGFERSDLAGLIDLMERNNLGWAAYLSGVVMQNPERPELAGELRESFCNTDPRVAREFARATFLSDHRADVPALQVPVLLMQCAGDPVAPPAAAAYLHRHLPRSRLVQMEATGHCPHVSHPRETIEAIAAFLEEPLSALRVAARPVESDHA